MRGAGCSARLTTLVRDTEIARDLGGTGFGCIRMDQGGSGATSDERILETQKVEMSSRRCRRNRCSKCRALGGGGRGEQRNGRERRDGLRAVHVAPLAWACLLDGEPDTGLWQRAGDGVVDANPVQKHVLSSAVLDSHEHLYNMSSLIGRLLIGSEFHGIDCQIVTPERRDAFSGRSCPLRQDRSLIQWHDRGTCVQPMIQSRGAFAPSC